ncbi:hypothetical protein BH10PSE6_BH10PSE6_53310 [soil metagenome]
MKTSDSLAEDSAYREYEVHLPEGAVVRVAFALGDMEGDSEIAHRARRSGALAYGTAVVLDGLDMPRHPMPRYPMVWTYDPTQVRIQVNSDDREPTPEVRKIFARQVRTFVNETTDNPSPSYTTECS